MLNITYTTFLRTKQFKIKLSHYTKSAGQHWSGENLVDTTVWVEFTFV